MIGEADVVEDLITREGVRYGDKYTRPPIDQPTGAGGITLAVLSEFLGRPASITELKAINSREAARPIVTWKVRRDKTRLKLDRIQFEPLRWQVLDFYYNSGAYAVRWLQAVLQVEVDGGIGEETIGAIVALCALDPRVGFILHHAYMGARAEMIDKWTDADAKRKQWEEGLENRAFSFSLLRLS